MRLPDETTNLRFRHLLQRHGLAGWMFAAVAATLAERGLMLVAGMAIDATLISAPSSTKDSSGQRDSDMQQTRMGNNWYFGMKAHIGVDVDSGLVQHVMTTSVNVHDLHAVDQ